MIARLPSVLLVLPLCLSCSTTDAGSGETGGSTATPATSTAGQTSGADGQNSQEGQNDGPMDGDDRDSAPGSDADTMSDDDAPDGGGCCSRHMDPGCDEPAVAECVCLLDAACCTFGWDDNCVDAARNECDATCEAVDDDGMDETGAVLDTGGDVMDTGGGDVLDTGGDVMDTGVGDVMDEGGGGAACCAPSMTPGCSDGMIEGCVCKQDPFCCKMEWDGQCADEAAEFCGADCGGGQDEGGGGVACCDVHQMTGCADMAVETCVCEDDPFCCNETWDEQCVDEANNLCGAGC